MCKICKNPGNEYRQFAINIGKIDQVYIMGLQFGGYVSFQDWELQLIFYLLS